MTVGEEPGKHQLLASGAAYLVAVGAAGIAAFYYIGLSYNASLLKRFGIEGYIQYDLYQIAAVGAGQTALAILVWALIGTISYFSSYLFCLFIQPLFSWKLSGVRDFMAKSGLIPVFFIGAVSFFPAAAVSGGLAARAGAWKITGQLQGKCAEYRLYSLSDGSQIVGIQIAGDEKRLAVVQPGGAVALIEWSEVYTADRKGVKTSRPSKSVRRISKKAGQDGRKAGA